MAEKQYDITALGEVLIDFTPHPGDDGSLMFRRNPGGAPLNMLAQAAKLGASCAFIGMVGDDGFGLFLRETALAAGVECRGLKTSAQVPTTLAFVHLAPDGERSFSFYRKPGADIMLSEADLDLDLIAGSRIFHYGSLSVTDEPSRSATEAAVKHAKAHGCVLSYDPNYRPALWEREADAVERMKEQILHADLVKVSEEEMEMITGETDPEKGSRAICEMGAVFVCVTYGKDGSFFRCADRFGRADSFPVKAVDTTGAGDAFWGTVLAGLKDMRHEEIRALDEAALHALVQRGNAAGALVASSYGAINSVRPMEDITALIGGQA